MSDPRQQLGKKLAGLTSNVAIIKFIVYYLGPVTVEEIAERMSEVMFSFSPSQESVDQYIMPILSKQGYYQEKDGRWSVVRDKLPEHAALLEVMERERRLLFEREVKSRLATALGCKVRDICLELDRDPRLKRFDGKWGLKEWRLVNDEVYEILREYGRPLSMDDLVTQAAEKLKVSRAHLIFDPRGDRRFLPERKTWGLREWSGKERSVTSPAARVAKGPQPVELELEESFLKARSAPREKARSAGRVAKVKLKKAAQQQARDLLRERTATVAPIEVDLATKLSQVEGEGESLEVTSYNRVEPSMKERSLATKEREAILSFIQQLMEMEDKSVGVNITTLQREPLSTHKILSLLKLKYLPYFTERLVIADDYYRFAAELTVPHPGQAVLNPAAQAGEFASHVLTAVFERMEGAAWAPHGKEIEVVQRDGVRYRLPLEGSALAKKAREDFFINQTNLLDYFLSNNFAAIENDRLLSRAARYNLWLSGFPGVYVSARDFLTQLPETFGEPPNENNEISLRFDLIFSNFTFRESHNLAANYLDQAVRLLDGGGIGAFFLLKDMLRLLKGHDFMRDLQQRHAFRYVFDFPQMEAGKDKDVVLVVLQRHENATDEVPLIAGKVKDLKALANILVDLAHNVRQSAYYEVLNQESVARVLVK
ncbi:MAG: hypothetical protein B1H03_02685 [Planctomycetales bacterium 4484_113]|nr:MAG: hypothetical protein B1H03_02685 [Planctomycetales bacterium 4484_113]